MNELFASISVGAVADWWAIVLLHSLWIATVVALVTGSLLVLVDHHRSGLRSTIALFSMAIVFIASVAFASYTTNEQERHRGSEIVVSTAIDPAAGVPLIAPPLTAMRDVGGSLRSVHLETVASPVTSSWLSRTVVGIWLLGAVLMLLRLAHCAYLRSTFGDVC